MENPFEIIYEKLSGIENLLRTLVVEKNNSAEKSQLLNEIFTLSEAAEYLDLTKSAIYKKTSDRNIPHFKQGKRLYFKRSELDDWMTQNRIMTRDEIQKQASDYIVKKGRFRL